MAAMRNKLAGEMAQPVAAREDAVVDTLFVGAGPTTTTTGSDGVGNIVETDSGDSDSSDSDSSGVGTDDEGTGNQRSDAAPGVAAEAGGGAASSPDEMGEGLDGISAGGHPASAPRGQKWRGKSPLFSKSIKDAPKPVLDAELEFLESMSTNLGFAETKNSSPERKFPTEVGGVVLSPLPSLCLSHRCTHRHM